MTPGKHDETWQLEAGLKSSTKGMATFAELEDLLDLQSPPPPAGAIPRQQVHEVAASPQGAESSIAARRRMLQSLGSAAPAYKTAAISQEA